MNLLLRNHHHQPLFEFTLYSFPPSTCSWRVRAALFHHLPILSRWVRIKEHDPSMMMNNHNNNNNISDQSNLNSIDQHQLYQKFKKNHLVHVDLFAKANEESSYSTINPMKQVPSLVIQPIHEHEEEEGASQYMPSNAMTLTQSLPIVEFLDHLVQLIHEKTSKMEESQASSNVQMCSLKNPCMNNNYLIPKHDLFLEFKTRQISEIINAGIQPMQNIQLLRMLPKELRGEQNKKWIGEWHRKGLRHIEFLLKEQYESIHIVKELVNSGTTLYSIREYGKLTLADLCLVPSVEASIERTDIHVEEEFPFSFAIYNSLKNLDVFTQTRS